MLIATWNSVSALRASACTGEVWSGSDPRCAGYLGSAMPARQARRLEASQECQEDSTRKQVIPHATGAPDS